MASVTQGPGKRVRRSRRLGQSSPSRKGTGKLGRIIDARAVHERFHVSYLPSTVFRNPDRFHRFAEHRYHQAVGQRTRWSSIPEIRSKTNSHADPPGRFPIRNTGTFGLPCGSLQRLGLEIGTGRHRGRRHLVDRQFPDGSFDVQSGSRFSTTESCTANEPFRGQSISKTRLEQPCFAVEAGSLTTSVLIVFQVHIDRQSKRLCFQP